MKENLELLSKCGLYFGACPSYKKGRCPGCAKNEKASWCKVRSCNLQKNISSCAECDEFAEVNDCKKFNNFISKAFGIVFNSDRRKGIEFIRTEGPVAFAAHMIQLDRVSLKRFGKNA